MHGEFGLSNSTFSSGITALGSRNPTWERFRSHSSPKLLAARDFGWISQAAGKSADTGVSINDSGTSTSTNDQFSRITSIREWTRISSAARARDSARYTADKPGGFQRPPNSREPSPLSASTAWWVSQIRKKRGIAQEKTPCSIRPTSASTSRAPISVSA